MLRLLFSALLALSATAGVSGRKFARRSVSSITIQASGNLDDNSVSFLSISSDTDYVQLVTQDIASTFSFDSSSQRLSATDDTDTDVFATTFAYLGDTYSETPAPVSFQNVTAIADCIDSGLCQYESWAISSSDALTIPRSSQPVFYACDDTAGPMLWVGPAEWPICTPVTLAVVSSS
ncbi:hypothetical protein TWF694_003749 [Orbilia ellipsospora]|uniref:Uncharacterized protein n=1 Tax=Orbilia ellipsospora TaxID=2528407 RepID=A0AAV9WZ52_9PEZI